MTFLPVGPTLKGDAFSSITMPPVGTRLINNVETFMRLILNKKNNI
jgi:hypothetical protein